MSILVCEHDGYQVPMLPDGDICVGDVVRACHDHTIDEGLSQARSCGLDRDSLDAVLVYCAERRCETDKATCPGCRRRAKLDQINTLDDFVARHREIVVGECSGDDGLSIRGAGEGVLHVEDFESLNKVWAGEEYWYWARRVLRKLRHGIRRQDVTGTPFDERYKTPSVVLVAPQLAENIGMAARAMANFGLDAMRLVAPRDGWPNEKARVAASGANYVIDEADAFDDVVAAVAPFQWVCATTARQRDMRKRVLTPAEAVREMRQRIGEGQKCAVMFGRESSGLSAQDVVCADALVMIPVNAEFASLNLAQAVLIIGYAWMLDHENKSLGRVTRNERPMEPGFNLGSDRFASKEELMGLFEHLEGELDRANFFNPPEKRAIVVRNLRSLLTRVGATAQEVRTLRGIVATLARRRDFTP